jgi:hypothetical protein
MTAVRTPNPTIGKDVERSIHVLSDLWYYPGICLKRLRKAMKNLRIISVLA